MANTYLEFKTLSRMFDVDVETGKEEDLVLPNYRWVRNQRIDRALWSPDGKKLAVEYGAEAGRAVVVDPGEERIERIATENSGIRDSLAINAWSPDSSRLALSIQDTDPGEDVYAPASLWIKNLKTGALTRIVSNRKGRSAYWVVDWSPDGR